MSGITKREQINRKIAASLSKMTPEVIERLRQAFSLDATIAEACSYANIHFSTYHSWIKKHPELSDEFARLREKPILAARQATIKGFATDHAHALKYLKSKRPQEFATMQKIQQEGKLQIEDVTPDKTNPLIKKIVDKYEEDLKRAIVGLPPLNE